MRVGVIIWSLVPGRGVGECGARLVVVLRLYLFCFSFVEVRRPFIIFHSTGYPSGISVLIQSAPLLSILICGSTCRTSFINRLMRLCASPVCCPSVLSSVWLVLSSSSSTVPVTGLSVLLWSLSSSLLSSFSFCQVLKSSAAVFVFGSSSSRQLSIDMVVPLWCPL